MTVNVKLPLYSIPLDHQLSLQGGTFALHLVKIWALEYWVMYIDWSVLLLLFFFFFFFFFFSFFVFYFFFLLFMLLLLLICHCASTITDEQQNYMVTTTTTERSIFLNCSIFLFWLFMLLLCNFFSFCSSLSVVVDPQLKMQNNNNMIE